MPRYPADPERDLRNAICDRNAVIVAGTGVSIGASFDPATSKPHPEASWTGLLQNGLHWLKDHDLDDGVADAHLMLLARKPQTHHFISAAEDVTAGMGGEGSKHFAEWLQRTIGSIKAHDRSVLDALNALRQHGNLLATTNYDDLLLDDRSQLTPVTWLETEDFLGTIRHRDEDKIIFLHGYWRKPETVILDWKSYDRIARHAQYRDDLAAAWKTNIWVYIGCGMDGLSDPDFGLLLERYGGRARQSGHWDYCLVLDDQRHEFRAHFDSNDLNLLAIAFGADYSELPKYLRSLLPSPTPADVLTNVPAELAPTPAEPDPIPTPPAFYAEPDYIGSHQFVGRARELEDLSDWAKPADPTNLLLYEAIGGNGKSMLTWEWTTTRATQVRNDWAGRFWYSFYERGAIMADFCQRVLAYMTGQPLKELRKKKTAELREPLLAQLHAKPWLLILDGLKRVLVAYHRIDAAEMPDEDANNPTDKIVNRNPCDAIRDEDNDLLRALAAAAPSKILVSSRLTPRVLLNPSGQPITGAKRITLPGLRPSDAEQLLRSCGRDEPIEGDSAAIQSYLATNCDNHPLVIGILGGLITGYLPSRGNFDAWAADPDGGAKLDLASLDLIQRRNHILRAALDALPPSSRQLLSTLALLSESVDYETLEAFNPHIPPEPTFVKDPDEGRRPWTDEEWKAHQEAYRALSPERKKEADAAQEKARKEHKDAVQRRKEYLEALADWKVTASSPIARKELAKTVRELEARGFVQFDGRTSRYDLHPVVRGVASGSQGEEEKERHGIRVVDHFSSISRNPYEQAETLEDLRPGLNVVRTLLKLGHFQQAANAYQGDFANALFVNVEAHAETLSLLRPFFSAGWGQLPSGLRETDSSYLANVIAIALASCGETSEALAAYGAGIQSDLAADKWRMANWKLLSVSLRCLLEENLLASALRVSSLSLELATVLNDIEKVFLSRLDLFSEQSRLGEWELADTTWKRLDPMGRKWSRAGYRPGEAEFAFAQFHYWQGTLKESHLTTAEQLTVEGKNRNSVRNLHELRGVWRLEQGESALAAASFAEAVRMARESNIPDAESETGLALAKHHLGQLAEPHREAERLAQLRQPAHRLLAQLWLALDDPEQAKHHALAAYRWAWADGEPYVHCYELTKTTELLQQMNVPIPNLPPYDPAKDEPFPWEADVGAAIEKLRAEKEAKEESD